MNDPSKQQTPEGHQWLTRGPLCWGIAPSRDEAVKNCLKRWPRLIDLKKPRGTDPEKWTAAQRKAVRIQLIPTGTIYISDFDGSVNWYTEADAGTLDDSGEQAGLVDHDPDTCDTCTIKGALR